MDNNLDKYGMDKRFAYKDTAAVSGKSTQIRRLEGNCQRIVVVDMYRYHSVVHVGIESDCGEGKKVLALGLNPKTPKAGKNKSKKPKKKIPILEKTRRFGIYSFVDKLASKGEHVDTYVQFDLYVDATDKASEVNPDHEPETQLEKFGKALNDADYALLAWGRAGQTALEANNEFTQALKTLLTNNSNKLYYFHPREDSDLCYSAAASISKQDLTKLELTSVNLFSD